LQLSPAAAPAQRVSLAPAAQPSPAATSPVMQTPPKAAPVTPQPAAVPPQPAVQSPQPTALQLSPAKPPAQSPPQPVISPPKPVVSPPKPAVELAKPGAEAQKPAEAAKPVVQVVSPAKSPVKPVVQPSPPKPAAPVTEEPQEQVLSPSHHATEMLKHIFNVLYFPDVFPKVNNAAERHIMDINNFLEHFATTVKNMPVFVVLVNKPEY